MNVLTDDNQDKICIKQQLQEDTQTKKSNVIIRWGKNLNYPDTFMNNVSPLVQSTYLKAINNKYLLTCTRLYYK